MTSMPSHNHPFDPDDPRLTAYVLNELDQADRAEIERLLAESPQARAAVDAIRETVQAMQDAFEVDEIPTGAAVIGVAEIGVAESAAMEPRRRMTRRAILSLAGTIAAASLLVAIVASDRGRPRPQQLAFSDRSSETSGLSADFAAPQGQRGAVDGLSVDRFAATSRSDPSVGEHGRLGETPNLPEVQMMVRNNILALRDSAAKSADGNSNAPSAGSAGSNLRRSFEVNVATEGESSAPNKPASAAADLRPKDTDANVKDRAKRVNELARNSAIAGKEVEWEKVGPKLLMKSDESLAARQPAKPESRGIVRGSLARGESVNGQAQAGQTATEFDGKGAGVVIERYGKAPVVADLNELGTTQQLQSQLYVDPSVRRPPLTAYYTLPHQTGTVPEGSPQGASPDVLADGYWYFGDLTGNGLADVKEGLRQYRYIVPVAPRPAPGNTEAYEPIVENEFVSPRVAPLSTFAVDVDTASYSNMRRFLAQGQLPPPSAVRIEELINYFKYQDPSPSGDKPFSVHLEAAACPWSPEHKLVRIGLKGKEIPRTERPPSNLVFLIDVSGSMRDDNKLPLVKSGLELLVSEMTENDRIAIVTYAGNAGVALESTLGSDRAKILGIIRGLRAGGSTNGEAGLQMAYDQAVKNLISRGANRVILCTDGDFNVGVSGDDELVQIIGRHATTGVYLSVFGFGMGNLKDAKLEKLADKGNGHYGYVDGIREAQKVFVEEMTGTLYTIAKDVKVQIEFNPAKVGAYRLIGYENRLMPAQDFHNDAKDAGDIGAGHSVTALYEIIPAGMMPAKRSLKYQPGPEVKEAPPANDSNEMLTLSLRYKRPELTQPPAPGVAAAPQKSTLEEYVLAEPTDAGAKTSDDFRWASAVAALGMILRDSAHKGQADLRMVQALAASSSGAPGLAGDDSAQSAERERRNEFLSLVETIRRIRGETLAHEQNDGVKE